jgi:hypothetical protein
VQYLKQAPLPADWNKFDIAATRVRHLRHDNELMGFHDSAIDLAFFHCLKVHGKCIRHLRELEWVEPDADIFPYVDLFLGPHLVGFRLDLRYLKEPIDIPALDICSSVKNLSPNISMLYLMLGWSEYPRVAQPTRLSDELSSLACSFPGITKINTNFPVTTEAIEYLSLSLQLAELLIPNDAAEILKIVTDAGLRRVFASLTTLTLSAKTPASCIEFLEVIRPVHLKSLVVRLGPYYISRAEDMFHLFIGVHDLCSHFQLERFIVDSDLGFKLDDEPLTPDIFEPLFAFENLSVFEARSISSDIDNACLKRLAIAWPNLSTLVLYTRPDDDYGRSKICLEGLAELVTRCPCLIDLTIELHISTSNLENWKEFHGDLSNDTFQRLDFGRSTFRCDAGELGRSLHILFPNLGYFHAQIDGDEPGYRWNDIAPYFGCRTCCVFITT